MKTPQWRRAVDNRCVFSAHLKALSDRSGDRSAQTVPCSWSVDCETSLSSCSPGRARGTSRVLAQFKDYVSISVITVMQFTVEDHFIKWL